MKKHPFFFRRYEGRKEYAQPEKYHRLLRSIPLNPKPTFDIYSLSAGFSCQADCFWTAYTFLGDREVLDDKKQAFLFNLSKVDMGGMDMGEMDIGSAAMFELLHFSYHYSRTFNENAPEFPYTTLEADDPQALASNSLYEGQNTLTAEDIRDEIFNEWLGIISALSDDSSPASTQPALTPPFMKHSVTTITKNPLHIKKPSSPNGRIIGKFHAALARLQTEDILADASRELLAEEFLGLAGREEETDLDNDPFKIVFNSSVDGECLVLSDSQEIYRHLIEKDMGDYRGDLAEGRHINEKSPRYKRLNQEHLTLFQTRLKKEKANAQEVSGALKKVILTTIRAMPQSLEARRVHAALQGAKQTVDLELLDCIRALMPDPKKEEEGFMEGVHSINSFLDYEEAIQLRILVLRFLEQETAIQQIDRVLREVDPLVIMELEESFNDNLYESHWKKACNHLVEERQYSRDQEYYRTDLSALTFEWLSGYRVREEQAKKIKLVVDHLFKKNTEASGITFQLMMGGGKTSTILSQLSELASNAEKIPLFLCHHSQYPTFLANLKGFQERFGQKVYVFDYNRSEISGKKGGLKTLETIRSNLKRAIANKDAVIMKSHFLQMLQDEAVVQQQLLISNHMRSSSEAQKYCFEKLCVFSDILEIFQTECVGFLDESDLNLDILTGVHLPSGKKKTLDMNYVHLEKIIFEFMAGDKSVKDIVRLQENEQDKMSPEEYNGKVLPKVARHLISDGAIRLQPHARTYAFFRKNNRALQRFIQGKIPLFPLEKFTEKQLGEYGELASYSYQDFISNKNNRGLNDLRAALSKAAVDVSEHVENVEFLREFYALGKALIQEIEDAKQSVSDNKDEFIVAHTSKQLKILEKEMASLQLIALSKHLLTVINPLVLSKSFNVSFGRREDGSVCPMLGPGVFNEGNKFADVFELLGYHMATAASKGIGKQQYIDFVRQLKESAIHEASKGAKTTFANTRDAKYFKELTGYKLEEALKEEYINPILEKVNATLSIRMQFEERTSENLISYHSQLISSSPVDMLMMLPQSVMCSGTIWNWPTYQAQKVRSVSGIDPVETQPGTEGKIVHHLLKQAIPNADGVSQTNLFAVDTAKIQREKSSLIQEILSTSMRNKNQEDRERVRGYIDIAALLKEQSIASSALEILALYSEAQEEGSALQGAADLKGVVYVHKEEKTGREYYALIKRLPGENAEQLQERINCGGVKPIELINSSKTEVERHGLAINELFFLYDKLRATGTDFPQVLNAINVCSVDPKGTTLRAFLQGVLRLRNFFGGQGVDVFTPKNALKYLPSVSKKMIRGLDLDLPIYPSLNARGEHVDLLQEMINAALMNQSIEKARQTYRSFNEQIPSLYRKMVLDKIFEFVAEARDRRKHIHPELRRDPLEEPSLQEMKAFCKRFSSYLISGHEIDPYKYFSALEGYKNPQEMLQQLRDKMAKAFNAQLEGFLEDYPNHTDRMRRMHAEVQEEIEKTLDFAMGAGENNPTNHLDFKVKAGSGGESLEANVNVELNVEVAKEVSAEQEVHVEQEIEKEFNRYITFGRGSSARKELRWDRLLSEEEVANIRTVEDLYSQLKKNASSYGLAGIIGESITDFKELKDVLQEGYDDGVSGDGLYEHPYHACFEDTLLDEHMIRIRLSPQYRNTTTHFLPVFHPTQKNGDNILVYKDDDGTLIFDMISAQEGMFVKKWIDSVHPENVFLIHDTGEERTDLIHQGESISPREVFTAEKNTKGSPFDIGLTYIQFFNGNLRALLKDELKLSMIRDNQTPINKKLRERYLKLKVLTKGDSIEEGRAFAVLLMNSFEEEGNAHYFITDEMREQRIHHVRDHFHDGDFSTLDKGLFEYIPDEFLKSEVFPVPEERLCDISNRQISLLPQEQVPKIITHAPEKVPYLRGEEQMSELCATLGIIDSSSKQYAETIAHLGSEVEFLDEQICYLTEEVQAQVITRNPVLISYVKEEEQIRALLENNGDRIIPYLDSEKTVGLIPAKIDSLQHITEGQYKYLSKEQIIALYREENIDRKALAANLTPNQIQYIPIDCLEKITRAQWILFANNLVDNDALTEEAKALMNAFARSHLANSAKRIEAITFPAFFKEIKDIKMLKYLEDDCICLLGKEMIKKIQPHQLEHVSERQVQWLTHEQLLTLQGKNDGKDKLEKGLTEPQSLSFNTEELVALLSPEQITKWLTQWQVKLLKTQKQIQACPYTLIHQLNKEQVPLVSCEQVPLLGAKQLEFLKKEDAIQAVTTEQLQYIGLGEKHPLWGRLTGDVVNRVPSERISRIADKNLKFLTRRESICKVGWMKVEHLTGDQLRTRGGLKLYKFAVGFFSGITFPYLILSAIVAIFTAGIATTGSKTTYGEHYWRHLKIGSPLHRCMWRIFSPCILEPPANF